MNAKKLIILFFISLFYIVLFFMIDNYNNILKEEEFYEEEYITVYLEGEAKLTGEFSVPKTWTIIDLIDLVGVTQDADTSSLNSKTLLSAFETYTIPKVLGADEFSLININTASKEDLMKLPQVGESMADRIISYRNTSPFLKIEDIKNVVGIGDKMYEKIKGLITV